MGTRIMFCVAIYFILFTTSICERQIEQSDSTQQCYAPLTFSVNNFGASLTNAIGGRENFVMSPLSIYTALALVYLGADGSTAEEMAKTLQLSSNGLDKTQLNEVFRDLLDAMKESRDKYQLSMANAIYLQQELVVNQQYVDDAHTIYDASVKRVDFVKNGFAVKDEVNDYIAENTNNKINEFLKEPLEPLTVLALFNAIYFKGTWKIQFQQEKTVDGLFTRNGGSTKEARLMKLEEVRFRLYNDDFIGYKFLELPYVGGDISMLLALPYSHEQVPHLNMTSDLLCTITERLRNKAIQEVVIPKFKLNYRDELVAALQQLGIHHLFSGFADLSGIRRQGGLHVSTVIHEAVIEVNEEGSEAAAATGLFISRMMDLPETFVADHPFLFYIVDNRNGLILFSGRVSDP